MKKALIFSIALAFSIAAPVFAQRSGEPQHGGEQHKDDERRDAPRANQGHIPPAPAHREEHARPEEERGEGGRVNNTPHVSNDHWYGHDRPDDRRYHIDRAFEHGHFEHFGPTFRYNIVRIDRDHRRFWLPGGFFFEVAVWDWPTCADWCWDCANDFIVYEDTDHIGWYLLYNIHTGVYVHVTYLGT